MGYETDIKLERKYARIIKAILGTHFITQDVEADLHEATDFLILTVKQFKVGARIRRYDYYERYPDQFTIRWSRPSGVLTEIDKINAELVDYILYGFENKEKTKILTYFIGDLEVFRAWNLKPIGVYPNNPPDSELAAFKLIQLPENFIIKRWYSKELREKAAQNET